MASILNSNDPQEHRYGDDRTHGYTQSYFSISGTTSRWWEGAAQEVLKTSNNLTEVIEGILRQTQVPLAPAWDRPWIVPDIASSVDPTTIAEKVDGSITTAFLKVPFYAWVRAVLGYEDSVVQLFLDGMLNARNDLARDFWTLQPPEKDKWISVKEASRQHFSIRIN